MSKFFTMICTVTLLLVANGQSQWQFVKNFPNDTFHNGLGSGCHGLAVDPSGRVWVQLFTFSGDSVVDASGAMRAVRVTHVFNPDGTPAPFSPIKTITVAGQVDTFLVGTQGNRGLRADHNGNILAASFTALYRLDYRTGQGLNKIIPVAGAALTAPGVDAQGNIFTAHVVPGAGPIQILDPDFNLLGVAVDTSRGFSRSFEVSSDGNTIYWAGYTNHAIYKYTRPDEFSSFALEDTILKGFDSESFGWNRKTGHLWLSAGSYNDLPNRFPGATTSWSPNVWYAYDPVADQVEDSLKWVFNTPANVNERPRAIAFSVSGDTAYVGCFGASDYPPVQMFVRPPVSVAERPNNTVPEGYSLSQNYPNPFNPTTEIKFSLGKPGFTRVKVFSVLGAEVATLVNQQLTAGNHSVIFDASKLAAGTYVYELHSNGVRLTKKMSLLK
jgi:hypothetical protein